MRMIATTIDAQLEFDFRGEHFCLSATIDLDAQLTANASLPPMYTLIARAHDIDPYSYQYEVMEMAEVTYTNPQGLAKHYWHEGTLDETGFVTAWQEQQLIQRLTPLGRDLLGIDDLQSRPDICRALLEAYRMGRDDAAQA